MVCPRMGGAGNPREFDFVKLYQGGDFDMHKCPLAGWKIYSVAILEGGEGLAMSGPPSWKYPEVIWMSLPHSLLGLSFHERWQNKR